MAINLTKSTWTDGATIEASEMTTLASDISSKFNAGITTADLSASAGLTNAQLANKHYEIILDLLVDGTRWAAAAAGEVVGLAGLPADTNADTYTIVQVDWCISCAATAITVAPKFDLVWGYFGSDTAWTTSDTIVNAQSLATVTANQGSAGTSTLADSSITMSTTNKQFMAVTVDTAGTGFAAADQLLCVSIKLKRTNGLRS